MEVYRPETTPSASDKPASPLTRAVGFAMFTLVGVAALAAAILGPEYAALASIRQRCAVLEHQVRCEQRLARHNDRLIAGMRTDPDLTTLLLIRQGNYRPAGAIDLEPTGTDESFRQRLLREARNPPVAPRSFLARAGDWLDDPLTRCALILLAMGTLASGVVVWGPWRARGASRSA